MARNDYIPNALNEFLAWHDNFNGQLPGLMTTFGLTQAELDAVAEAFLAEQFGLNVDFEAPDAIEKLVRFKLIQTDTESRLRAAPIDEALRRLDTAWDEYFLYSNNAAKNAADSQ